MEIGDTGKFHSTIGTYDITLNSAEIKKEIDGEPSELEQLVLLDITVKNMSDKSLELTDIIEIALI